MKENQLRLNVKLILDVLGYDVIKAYAGTLDMLALARDMQREIQRDGSIDYKYQRPKGKYNPVMWNTETPESLEADRLWQVSENGRKAAEEKKRAVKEFHETIQNALKSRGVPYDHPSVTVFNRETLRLSGIMEKQSKFILEMRDIHSRYSIPMLREMAKQVEQRARRGVGLYGEPTN